MKIYKNVFFLLCCFCLLCLLIIAIFKKPKVKVLPPESDLEMILDASIDYDLIQSKKKTGTGEIKIVLKKDPGGNFIVDKDKTVIPEEITIKKVETIKKIDWLEPVRVAVLYSDSISISAGYTVARIHITERARVEAGLGVNYNIEDKKITGVASAGLYYGNVGALIGIDTNKELLVGIGFRVF